MAAAAKNRSELQDVAHPGFRVVYFQTTDRDGKKIVVPHTLPEIDAQEAGTKFPDQYSYDEPDNAGPIVAATDAGASDPYAPPPPAPPITSPAAPMGPITDGTAQRPAAITEADSAVLTDKTTDVPPVAVDSVNQKVVAANEKAVDQAKADKPK